MTPKSTTQWVTRGSALLWLLSATLVPVSAQTPLSWIAINSLTLQRDSGDTLQAEVELVNTTADRTITAYTIVITTRYPDGTARSRKLTTDAVWSLSLEQLGSKTPPCVRLDPGCVIKDRLTLPGNALLPLPTAEARVEMLALSDKTAYGDSRDIEALQVGRVREAEEFADVCSAMDAVQLSADRAIALDAYVAAEQEKTAPQSAGERKTMKDRMNLVRSVISPLIENHQDMGLPLRACRARVNVLREHSRLNGLSIR